MPEGYTKIYLGRLEMPQVRNIAREVQRRWMYFDKIWPNGDRKQVPNIKFTKDRSGQYYAHINQRGLMYLLLYCKDIPDAEVPDKQATEPMPPDFLLNNDG